MPKFTVEQTDRSRYRVAVPMTRNKDWEQWFLLMSDAHFDNPHCRRDLLKEDLDEAVARDAIILDGGDYFCAMQGWGDPRANKGDIRPEDNNDRYLDSLVDHATEFLAPYAGHIATMSRGNHELSVRKRKETDLTERTVAILNNQHGGKVLALPIASHIALAFDSEGQDKTRRYIKKLYMHHGYGGGGPVTKGIIQANRQAVYLCDADIVWSGHIHESWVFPIKRDGTSEYGRAIHSFQWHVRTPTYKDEYHSGEFHDVRGGAPKPLGSMWLRFFYKRAKPEGLDFEFIQNIR